MPTPRQPEAKGFWTAVLLPLLALVWCVASVEARTVRVATFNVLDGLDDGEGDPQAEYAATKSVLARINADIVAFQELETATRAQWEQMAVELGYPYKVMVEANGSRAGFLYLGYFSRFPMQTRSVNSPAPASEMSRVPLRAVVQVPGAAKPLVIWNMHHKATSTDQDRFRRAVEAYRIVEDIDSYLEANPTHDEFLVMGDLNEDISRASSQNAQFSLADYQAFRSLFPRDYVLGADLEAQLAQSPLPYRTFPDDRYAGAGGGLHRLNLFQQNGETRITRPRGGSILDYIFVSTALRNGPFGFPRGEVYNSEWDTLHPGLPKAGQPLDAGTSAEASDHLAVFADIEMADAEVTDIASFSPPAAAPGATVTITGFLLGGVQSVRFGGVEASILSVSDTQITATVPAGAVTGPITVSGPDGEADSFESFLVASLPTAEFAVPTPSSLEGFTTMSGAPSAARSLTISAAGLRGPLQVTAPAGFEVSRDGVSFGPSVEIAAPPRQDSAANYGVWADGSNGGNGFGAWSISAEGGSGRAEAYIGDPANSEIEGMASTAFALRAEPQNSTASVWTYRPLQRPLAVGEALSFDWGINWDANNDSYRGKGFIIASGSAAVLYVEQGGWPGAIRMWHNDPAVDTGIAYGTKAMRWTLRQVDSATLNITATSRTNRMIVALSTNISVPGAVTGFWWFADRMDPDPRRISYYDNLSIEPSGPGGGALEAVTVQVRLAADAGVGAIDGQMQLTSGGEGLASVSLSGTVTGAGVDYENWAAFYGLDPQGDGAPGADRDGDGHSNWLEFAFGTSPVASDGALIETRTSWAGVTFEFLRRQNGVIYNILHTANLATAFSTASWIELSVSSDQAGVPEGWEKLSFTVPAQGAGFYRISASPD